MGTIALTACSSTDYFYEEEEPVTPQPLRIVTTTKPLAVETAPVKQEMINTYTLVYVNTATRRVEAIQNFDKKGEAVEYDIASFPIEISEKGGTDQHEYKVYAFANFTPELKNATKFDITHALGQLTVGTVLDPTYESSLNSTTLDLTALNGHNFTQGDRYIPMTAVVDYNATMQYHQPVNVPLVRMLAKLDFQIRNNTSGEQPLRLQKISIRPIQNAPVYLLPHLQGQTPGFYPTYPAADEQIYGANANPDGVKYLPVVPSLSKDPVTGRFVSAEQPDTTHITLDLTTTTKGYEELPVDGSPVNVGTLYVNESLAKWHPTGHFTYDVVLTTATGEKRQYRYALSDDDFTAFLRNDHVTIPLTITSPSSLQPEVIFYPPIGGYPPVITDKDDDEFYATFATPGDFAIYPHIYREGARTDIRLTDAEEVEFSAATDITVTGDNIFTKQPRYSAGDNCIKATLGTTKGHAIITITAKMKDSNQLVSKKMHIIRE